MALGPEYEQVERPLIEQLKGMGWTHLEGAPPGAVVPIDSTRSGRRSFSEVFLMERLRNSINVLNLGPAGDPWLTPGRISQMVNALARIPAPGLLEANQQATSLLLNGTTAEGLPGWDGGRDQRVKYIDWEHPERNDFVLVSQFRVDIPGTQGKKCIVPDEVLFVNGIPFALIECKKPGTDEAIAEAIRQHMRYADRRGAEVPEGNPKLFHTMQLLVATCGDRARLGSITSEPEHYERWRDPYPMTRDELAERLKKHQPAVNAQDILAGVVLHPYRLLDIVHNYVTFMLTDEGKMIKVVPRYPQYRAVCKAVERLQTGATKRQDGYADRRGGIIWHTQGAGKSLTMTFLVRKLRVTPDLARTKVVVVTDRTQLQTQLGETMELAGEKVDITRKVRQAKALLSRHGPGVVFVMIQKQQDVEARETRADHDELSERKTPSLGELNTDESIVVLIDEAHRSHSSTLHMNMMEALPNCARIGFTGTPILMGAKKKTTDIFGSYIDVYPLADAEKDEAVVPILYAGRAVKGAIRDGRDLDEVFEDMFADHTPEELEGIQRKYATEGDVLEAEKLIAAKAKNILRHYVETVLPNRLKAQLVAHSRRATLRYRAALLKARDELVIQIENLPEHVRDADPGDLGRRAGFLVRAAQHLDLLKALDFVPVISAGTANEEKDYEPWTDPDKQQALIDNDFTKPFPAPDELVAGKRPVAFVIVKSMLLTGFDAPVEQVLYLDRSMREAELLQAVARVNRPAAGKKCGYVIDYAGVTNHLAEALKAYDAEDIQGALKDLREQIGRLDPQQRRLRLLFTERGVTPAGTEEAKEDCVALLEDGPLRDRFETNLKQFLSTVDMVLPLPDARPYLPGAKLFAEISLRARRRYRADDSGFDPSLYGDKVRELIDEHLESLGVEDLLPPVSLTSADFQQKVAGLASPRARASEMEHAIRHHINVHLAEDPTRYRRLSERLEQILAEHAGNWEQQVLAFGGLLDEMKTKEAKADRGDSGLNRVELALYGVVLERTATDGVTTEHEGQRVADLACRLHALASEQTTRVDFWRKPVDQANFAKEITGLLIQEAVCTPKQAPALADALVEVIRANRSRIPRPERGDVHG
jgi:type I restriction enzyme R subunit